MKLRIQDNEWQFLGQLMLDIANGLYPVQYNLECAVLYEWYQSEVDKFAFPKTRVHRFKMSQFMALRRVLLAMPDQYDDAYWQIIKNELASKLDQIANQPAQRLHG